MESILESYIFIYLFTLIMFLKPEQPTESQKIYIIYIITFLVSFNKSIDIAALSFVALSTMFIYLEYFTALKFKRDIMTNFFDKFIDFFYIMISEYCLIQYSIILFLNSSKFKNYLFTFKELSKNKQYILMIIFLVNIFVFIKISKNIFEMKWKIKSFDEINERMEQSLRINYYPTDLSEDNFEIVTRLEDKSFYKRKNYGTIFSFDYLKNYAIPESINYLMNHLSRVNEGVIQSDKLNLFDKMIKLIKVFLNDLEKISNLIVRIWKSLKRGHSTIEAQLIRSIGIKQGYDEYKINIIKRKIFEVIYTRLVFSNLKKFYKKHYYANAHQMKNYLMYVYLANAKGVILNREFIGLQEMFHKKIEFLNQDELFIGALTFSRYNLTAEKILKFSKIYNYEITIDRIEKELKLI